MIKSMTGFASVTVDDEAASIDVTIKTVNHRFLDVQFRIPSFLAGMEARIRNVLQTRIVRGRVEVAVAVKRSQIFEPNVKINEPFVVALRSALDGARAKGLIAGALTPGDILRWPHAVTVFEQATSDDPEVEGRLEEAVAGAVAQAVTELDVMRVREGGQLAADLGSRVDLLAKAIEQLATLSEDGRKAIIVRLHQRIAELGLDVQTDSTAVAQEVVRAAGRSDVAEEVTRFRAHLEHWRSLVGSSEPCGRKLDFLLQEMNREINTIGSKASGDGVSDLVIEGKTELERMREQVQNVE
jgi:uncharacterized protein (TIGR00255 family)